MRLLRRPLGRPLAWLGHGTSRRPYAQQGKSGLEAPQQQAEGNTSRYEEKFQELYDMKEPDFDFEVASSSEVLFSNLHALRNRMQLLRMMNLTEQIDLDATELRRLGQASLNFELPQLASALQVEPKDDETLEDEPHKAYLRWDVCRSAMCGLRDFVVPQDAQVRLTFYPRHTRWSFEEGMKEAESQQKASSYTRRLSAMELHKFILLCGPERYDVETGRCTLVAASFPFVEQNKQYLRDVLAKLLAESMVSFFHANVVIMTFTAVFSCRIRLKS